MVVGTVTVNGTNPILAWNGVGAICLERITVSGSTFTFRLRAKSNTNIGLQYWVFDTAASATKDPTMAGIEAAFYDQYGVTTFDATMAAMRIVDAIETPKDAEVIPHGMSSNLGGYTNVTVPSGKVYAVVQSTVGFVMTTYDTGAYSNSSTRPNQIEIGDGGEPGPGMRWRYQRLESYQSTGGYTSANNIRVGMTQFEQWEVGWQPASAEPHINVYGQARHMIVDVTNFTSATAPNPTVVTGGVNATSRSVSTGGASTISQSVTPSVTCSASGGTAPYSYLWERISGDTTVVANGSATSASFSTSTSNQPQATTRSAVWRCRITDNNGIVGYSPEVTFSHVAQAYTAPDYTPDPLNWSNVSASSSTDLCIGDTAELYFNGINQPITIRATISSSTGTATDGELEIWKNSQWAAKSTTMTNGSWAQTTVSNGERISFRGYIRTTSGARNRSYTVTVTNQTTGATIDTFTVNLSVDTDTTPATITNWPSINGVVNEHDYSWSTSWHGEHYVTGINTPITVRFEVYDYSGNLDGLYMDVFTWPPGGGDWTHHGYFNAHIAGPDGLRKFDVPNVVNGTRVSVNPRAVTNGGRKSATCRLVLWSITGAGGQFASADQSFTVDNDNNYFITPNPISIPTLSVTTNDPTANTSVSYFQITGINQPITLRFSREPPDGNLYTRRLVVAVADVGAGSGGPWTYHNVGANNTLDIPNVENGRWFYVHGYLETQSGRASGGWQTNITNVTTGAQIASFRVEGTVDADNNHNVADVIPNAVGTISPITPTTTAEVAWGAPRNFQITGINQEITLRVTKSHVSQSGNVTRKWLYVRTSTDGTNFDEIAIMQNDNQTFDFTVTNNMWVQFGIQVLTSAGRANAQWNVTVTNRTGSGTVATMAVDATVDSDDNYNVAAPPTVTLDRYSDSQFNFSSQGILYTTHFTSRATVTGGQAPLSYQWEKVSGFGGWTIGSPTSTTTAIRYEGRTNYNNVTGIFRLKVTDGLGRVAYSPDLYLDASAGDSLS